VNDEGFFSEASKQLSFSILSDLFDSSKWFCWHISEGRLISLDNFITLPRLSTVKRISNALQRSYASNFPFQDHQFAKGRV